MRSYPALRYVLRPLPAFGPYPVRMSSDAAEARAARQREIEAYVKAFETGAVGSGSADDPLRAMFPSSFGKTGKGGRRADGDSGDEAMFALTRKTDGAGAAKDGGRVATAPGRKGRKDDDDDDELPDEPPTVVRGAPVDDDTVGPMPPPSRGAGNDDDDDDFDDDDDDADGDGKGGAEDDLPITHEALLKDHTRVRAAQRTRRASMLRADGRIPPTCVLLAFAPGHLGHDARALGRTPADGLVRLQHQDVGLCRDGREHAPLPHDHAVRQPPRTARDGAWLRRAPHCLLTVRALARNVSQIADVQWSLTGDRYLVAPASAQAKCFDREGKELYVPAPLHTPVLASLGVWGYSSGCMLSSAG